MKSLLFLVLSVAATIVSCQRECGVQDVTEYFVDNLDADCGANYIPFFANVPSPQKDTQIREVCRADCVGSLANWFERECKLSYNASSLYYLCLGTSNTATVGGYCVYAIPPGYDSDAEIAALFAACQTSLTTCSTECSNSLNMFVDTLGCCYQSLYANFKYLQSAVDIGEIPLSDLVALQGVSNWMTLCNIDLPGECTAEAFSFPTGGGFKAQPQLQVLVFVIVLATAVLGLL